MNTRRIVVAFAVCVAVSVFSRAAPAGLLLYDGFDYGSSLSDGDVIASANGGSGNWNGAWSGDQHWKSTGLTYSNGGDLQTTDGAVADDFTGSDAEAYRSYISGLIGADDTVWFSYLVQYDNGLHDYIKFGATVVGNGPANGFGSGTGTTGYGIANERLDASINDRSAGQPLDISGGGTHFIVGKMEMSSTGSDVLSLWFDIALTETEATIGTPDSTLSGNVNLAANQFVILSGNGALATYDEVRLGDSLADVAPIPEPSTSALAALSLLGLLAWGRRRKR